MNRRLGTCLGYWGIAGFCLLNLPGARAEEPAWTLLGPSSGPEQFRLMAVDPQDGRAIYAGGQEGLYKSQDRGDTWQRVYGEGGPRVIAVDPRDSQVVFFGGEQGIHRSTDRGQTWQQVSQVNASALAIDPQDDQVVYIGGDHRIYRSADQGEQWQPVKDSLDVYVIAIDPQDHEVIYAACREGLYRSRDSGTTWEEFYKGRFSHLIIDPRDTQVMYALGNATVLKSADGGKTWNRSGNAPQKIRYHALMVNPRDSGTLYAADLEGIYRSADRGETWEKTGPGSGSFLAMALDPRQPQTIYVGTEEGNNEGTVILTRFFRSEDGGRTWRELSFHIPVFSVAQDPQESQVLYVGTDRGLYASRDAGQHWALANREPSFAALIADPQMPGRLYGGGQGLYGIYWSEDQGRTWAQISDLGGRVVSVLLADSRQPARLYAVAGGGAIFQSLDQGKTWTPRSRGLLPVRSLAIADTLVLYAGTMEGVYKSTDGGNTWARATVSFEVNALAVAPLPPYTVYASTTGLRDAWIYSSEDGGRTWSLGAPLPSRRRGMEGPIPPEVVSLAVDPRHSQVVYVATRWDGIYRSQDRGTTWEFFDTGLPPFRGNVPDYGWYSRIPRLFFPPAPSPILYAATEWGLYRIELPAIPGLPRAGEGPTGGREDQWTSTGPSALLYGGFDLGIAVSTLAVDPQEPRLLYAGTSSGRIFKRTPDGAWSEASRGLPGTAILDLSVDPQNGQRLYAGVEGRPAVYQTQDGGQSWRPASGNSLFGSVHAVAFDPQNSQVLYGGMNTVLVKTLNGGQRWEKVFTVPAQFSSIAIDPQDPQTVYAGARNPQTVYGEGGPGESGIYKSADSGAHWQRVMEGRVVEVALDSQDPKTLYALTEQTEWSPRLVPAQRKIHKSADGGQTWEELDTGLPGDPVSALAVDPQQQGVLYIAARGRVFKSADGGRTWADVEAGLPNTPVHALAVDAGSPRRLFAATERGMYSNENLHNPALEKAEFPLPDAEIGIDPVWTPSGIDAPVHDLVIAPSDPRVVYAVAGGALYKRGPDEYWALVSSGDISGFLLVNPHDSETLYTSGVNKSEDGGKTWTRVTLRDWGVGGYAAAIDPRNSQVVYVGGGEYLEKSTDGGKRWSNAVPPGYPEISFGSLAIDPGDPQTLYAGSTDPRVSGLFKSEDGGESWRQVTVGRVEKLAVDWQDPQQVYALTEGALYHSADRGERWSPLPLVTESRPLTALALDWQHSGTLYAAARGQVYKSVDWGTSWTAMGSGLPDTTISVLAVEPLHPQLVYAGTAKGLYRTSPGTTTPADTAEGREEESLVLPASTALGQNFPNPFNLQTVIPYQLASGTVVRLEIFDLQGHCIRTLKQGLQPAGVYRLIWDGRDEGGQEMASGVYLIRLEVGNYSALRKALLVK